MNKIEIDIWGTARKMREVYGVFAAATAAKRARQAESMGNLAASERWRQIAEILLGPAGDSVPVQPKPGLQGSGLTTLI